MHPLQKLWLVNTCVVLVLGMFLHGKPRDAHDFRWDVIGVVIQGLFFFWCGLWSL
jgi:hypothetical protein